MTPSIIIQRNEANQVTCIDAMQMALLATDPQGCGYNDRDAWTSSYWTNLWRLVVYKTSLKQCASERQIFIHRY